MRIRIPNRADYIIHTKRLGLRLWRKEDIHAFSDMNSDPEVMRYFPSVLTPHESAEALTRIMHHFEIFQCGLFAVDKREDGKFIGFTGFNRPAFDAWFTPCVEIGWRLNRESWGMGYATEAALACLDYGFKRLKFDKIYSFTSLLNRPSERVMQKIGMLREGEFDHPKIEPGNRLCRHVLYSIQPA